MKPNKRPPSTKELAICTRQLSTMLSAGIPILSALGHLERQTRSPSLRHALNQVRASIADGITLSESLRQHPLVFNRLYTALIHAGERAGILEETLETIANELEQSHALRSKIISAATYPAVVLLTLIGVLIFLLTWVIPTFEDLFAETGVALPWLTRQLLNTSEIVSSYWLLAFNSLILALIAAILCYRHIDTARQRIAEMTARLPIYGALLRKRLATQSATLLSALIRSGIPILEALTIIAESAPTTKLANEMTRVRHDILQGNQLSSSLERSTILPPIVAQMAAIGETSGRLDLMLGKAGALIKQELDATIEKLKQLTEPCLVLTVGVVVGIIAIAIYAPIFQLGELTAAR